MFSGVSSEALFFCAKRKYMTLFESVKDCVTTHQAAERYVLHVGHEKCADVNFHSDRDH